MKAVKAIRLVKLVDENLKSMGLSDEDIKYNSFIECDNSNLKDLVRRFKTKRQ